MIEQDTLYEFLANFSPWLKNGGVVEPISGFRREVFVELYESIRLVPQIISVTGPRRIGKSVLLHQLIEELHSGGVAAERLIYYSLDDPRLLTYEGGAGALIDELMKSIQKSPLEKPFYIFLDEIHQMDHWELYLKKYYDLKYPVRFIISGSASSPIFKKSRESLMGRIKDHPLLPFSFREFVLFRIQEQPKYLKEAKKIMDWGEEWKSAVLDKKQPDFITVDQAMQRYLDEMLGEYFIEGGYPEVWTLPTLQLKQEYLFDNQIQKVIYEDLIVAAEFRKPELLKKFFVSLLGFPGQELTIEKISLETGIKQAQITKYLPLLELTSLIFPIYKFRSHAAKMRKGKMKIYLVDLALRNALMRIDKALLADSSMLGLYAENAVLLALKKMRGILEIDYYREKNIEVDFILHTGPKEFLPIEVKYRNTIKDSDTEGIRKFPPFTEGKCLMPIMTTKDWDDIGVKDGIAMMPLPLFLMMY